MRVLAALRTGLAAERLELLEELSAFEPEGELEVFVLFQLGHTLYECGRPQEADDAMRAVRRRGCRAPAHRGRDPAGLVVVRPGPGPGRPERAQRLGSARASCTGPAATSPTTSWSALRPIRLLDPAGARVPDEALALSPRGRTPGCGRSSPTPCSRQATPTTAHELLGEPAPAGASDYSVLAGTACGCSCSRRPAPPDEVRDGARAHRAVRRRRRAPTAPSTTSARSTTSSPTGTPPSAIPAPCEYAERAVVLNERLECAPWQRRSEALVARLSCRSWPLATRAARARKRRARRSRPTSCHRFTRRADVTRGTPRCPRPCPHPTGTIPAQATTPAAADPGNQTHALEDLRRRVVGRLHTPADETWDAARTPWIVNVPQHPMAVLEVHDADDVIAAVRWAVEHGVAGHARSRPATARPRLRPGVCCCAPVPSAASTVDVQRRTAWVGAGVKAGELLAELDGTGLTFLAGSNPDPTVVGMTITGGISWFSRALRPRRRQHRHRRAGRRARPPAPGQRHRGPGAVLGGARRRRRLRDHHPDGGRAAPRPGGVRRPAAVADRADGRGAPHLQDGHRGGPDELTIWYHTYQFPPLPEVPEPIRGKAFAVDRRGVPRQPRGGRGSCWRRSGRCPGWRWT